MMFIDTSYQKLPFGSGDYPDKLSSCTDQPMGSLPSFFLSGRYVTDTTIRKILKCRKNSGFPAVCTCGLSSRFEFQIEIRKIEQGIAKNVIFLVNTCFVYEIVLW